MTYVEKYSPENRRLLRELSKKVSKALNKQAPILVASLTNPAVLRLLRPRRNKVWSRLVKTCLVGVKNKPLLRRIWNSWGITDWSKIGTFEQGFAKIKEVAQG